MSSVTVGPSTVGKTEGGSSKLGGLLSKIAGSSKGSPENRGLRKRGSAARLDATTAASGGAPRSSSDFQEFLAEAGEEEKRKSRTLEDLKTFPAACR